MKCQVTGSQCVLALQGQFLVRNRCERGCTRLMLRGGGHGGFVCAGVGVNEIPGTEIGCQQSSLCRCGTKTWPYRPMGPRGRIPGFHPGPVGQALQAGIAAVGAHASGGCQSSGNGV
jgi:hypothetical protein